MLRGEKTMVRGLVAAGVLLTGIVTGAAAEAPAVVDTGMAKKIALPPGGDAFATLAARAAAGDKTVDMRALRLAYVASAQRKARDAAAEDALLRQVLDAHQNYEWQREADAAVALLSVNFISLEGYKGLEEACLKLNDAACREQASFMKNKLFVSIINGLGGGKDCATGWVVVSAEEEDYMMKATGARNFSHTPVAGTPGCETLNVDRDGDGKIKTWYVRRADLVAVTP